MVDDCKRLADQFFPEVVRLRRLIHRHPELAYEERGTAQLVCNTLRPLGLPVRDRVAGTGVVATLEGAASGPTVVLRADMDALPIQEATGLDFSSQHCGVMHACGHDAHTSSLLGTALILHRLRDHISGRVRFVFQPSEEALPSGAHAMITEGILDGKRCTAFGQHVYPALPTGTIAVRGGNFMASADEIRIKVTGTGGHAAEPHTLSGDMVLAAAQVVVALQSLVSRHCPPTVPSVLSIGRIVALGATNIIPSEVLLEGTFRAMDEDWRVRAHDRIRQVTQHTAQAHGATADVDIRQGPPVVYNHPDAAALVRRAAHNYVGASRTLEADQWLGCEDFAYFLQRVPGTFYLVGAGCPHALHTPRFTVDEQVLATTTGFMAYLAWMQLQEP